jgi:hypothetical protein
MNSWPAILFTTILAIPKLVSGIAAYKQLVTQYTNAFPDLHFTIDGGKGIDARQVFLIGNTMSDLTPHGLWPSDHAGVVESFTLLP